MKTISALEDSYWVRLKLIIITVTSLNSKYICNSSKSCSALNSMNHCAEVSQSPIQLSNRIINGWIVKNKARNRLDKKYQ